MRVSQTHRSLSNKRNVSQNQSAESLEVWDNVGLLNSRLSSLQQIKGPIFRKYQGDKILEHKRKVTYDDAMLLPQIDLSMKMNNSINQTSLFAKKHPVPMFPAPIKKEIKSDKIKLLVMLSQLKKEYQKEQKPTQTVCLLLQEVLEILQKQDNIYGDDMKTLFSIINAMIFCVQQDIIECIQKIQVSTDRKVQDNLVIKPYFEYIVIMKEEIERHNLNALSFQKKLENEILTYQTLLKQADQKFYATGESQRNEIEAIKKNHQDEINIMQENIDSIKEELQRAVKENTSARDSTEKWKLKYEDQEKRFIDQIQQSADYQSKYQTYKTQFESLQVQKECLEIQLTQIQREKQELEERLGLMTPKPNFHFHNLFDHMGIQSLEFDSLCTNDKVEFLKEKMEEKINEVAELQDKQHSKALKKKGSRVLGVFVQTKRQGSTNDDKISLGGGGSQKNLDKSPTRKKLSDQKNRDSAQISPSSPTKVSSKDLFSYSNSQSEGVVKRNMKKSSTYVQPNKNTGSEFSELQTFEDYANTPQLKNQPRSQVIIGQVDQISNFSAKLKQSDERRVQFKQQSSGSEQGTPSMKFNNNRFSNIN